MALSKYRWHHQQMRQHWALIVATGQAQCAEPICLHPTRTIQPWQHWHLAHDPTGTRYIGVSHARCNLSEGGYRRQHPGPQRSWNL